MGSTPTPSAKIQSNQKFAATQMPASEKEPSPVIAAPTPSLNRDLPVGFQKIFRLAMLVALLVAAGWLWWNCQFNKEINFLPRRASAEWIVFPLPPDGHLHTVVELTGIFRRSFVLEKVSADATISWRAFKGATITLNGAPIDSPPKINWKETSTVAIGKLLRTGTNEISVAVTNAFAPPALSLSLRAGNFAVNTDESWEVSLLGSAWKSARLASVSPAPGKGNVLSGGENLSHSLRSTWPRLATFFVLSTFLIVAFAWWVRRMKRLDGEKSVAKFTLCSGIAVMLLWALLLIHNFRSLAPGVGYDIEAHLDYINYIQTKHALPLANEGWEMFQPPLYYLVSSFLLSIGNFTINDASGIFLLRLFALGIGLANVAFIFLSLRLLFPNDLRKQILGAMLAAFLPAHLYLLHYVTNETLAAMFISASTYFCLRVLREAKPPVRLYITLGACCGAAMLSKTSALLALPFLFGALLAKAFLQRENPGRSLRAFSAMLIVFLALCGWHYWRVWKHFGNPLIGNWDPALGRAWWQGPGYHTSAYYFSFGESLVRPIFSAFKSFGDGLYSTLWGDALCGGCAELFARTPWNYDSMTVNYLISIVPTALIMTGLLLTIKNIFRRAQLEWIVLLGIAFTTGFSILYMTTKLTTFAQSKAFYGLLALLPLCVFAVTGLDFFLQKPKSARVGILTLLGLWLLNTGASFWIHPDTIPARLSNATALVFDKHVVEAVAEYAEILRLDPGNAEARIGLAKIASNAGHPDEAVRQLNLAISENPQNGKAHAQLAIELAMQNHVDPAIAHARDAAKFAPESPLGSDALCAALLQSGHPEEALAAGREALAVVPSLMETHFNIGLALVQLKREDEAIAHFASVLQMDRNSAQAHYQLDSIFAKKGQSDQARKHLTEAVRLDPDNQKWRVQLEKISHEAK